MRLTLDISKQLSWKTCLEENNGSLTILRSSDVSTHQTSSLAYCWYTIYEHVHQLNKSSKHQKYQMTNKYERFGPRTNIRWERFLCSKFDFSVEARSQSYRRQWNSLSNHPKNVHNEHWTTCAAWFSLLNQLKYTDVMLLKVVFQDKPRPLCSDLTLWWRPSASNSPTIHLPWNFELNFMKFLWHVV